MGESVEVIKNLKDLVDIMCGGNQSLLARQVGVTPGYIGEIIRGKRDLSGKVLKALAKGGVNLNWLLANAGPMYVSQDPKDQDFIDPMALEHLQNENRMLKSCVRDKEKIVQMLEDQLKEKKNNVIVLRSKDAPES